MTEGNKPCKHSADDIEYGKNTICKLGHTTTRYGDILCVPENCEYLKMQQECKQLYERNRALNDEIKILKEALKKLGNFCTEENNLGGCGIHKDCSHCRRYFAQEQFARIENMNK